ncbi:hypothetical protein ABH926_005063 [Catenulispora sp. GP43]|uniref:hypothetical protein n=1 Tax=Catenulispora sp. GP43 TaxID=3156263 RepID=UPI003516FD8E
MTFETCAYDDATGRPVVVLVATGSYSVASLVAALRTGGTEQVTLAGRLADQVKRHNTDRQAVRLLAAHAGFDLPTDETGYAWHTVRRTLATNPATGWDSDVLEVTHPDQCRLLPAGAVCWADHAGDVPWWPWGFGTYQFRPVWEANSAEVPELVEVMQVKAFDEASGTWLEFEDVIGDFARCVACGRISDAGQYVTIVSLDGYHEVCVPCDRAGRDAGPGEVRR